MSIRISREFDIANVQDLWKGGAQRLPRAPQAQRFLEGPVWRPSLEFQKGGRTPPAPPLDPLVPTMEDALTPVVDGHWSLGGLVFCSRAREIFKKVVALRASHTRILVALNSCPPKIQFSEFFSPTTRIFKQKTLSCPIENYVSEWGASLQLLGLKIIFKS